MPTKTASYVEFDISELPVGSSRGRVVGLDVERNPTPLAFRGKVATESEGFGDQYQNLHKGSIVLGDELALWNAYQMERLGKFKPTKEQKAVFDYLFERRGWGNVVDNAVDYNDHGKLTAKEGFSRALIITQPDGFKFNNESNLWEPVLGDNSKVEHLHLPKSGYVKLTNDGSYHPSGFPFDTSQTRVEAEQSWVDKGFTQEFATFAVSYFWSRQENTGTSAVDRWFWLGDDGRFSVDAYRNPDGRNDGLGRFSASR